MPSTDPSTATWQAALAAGRLTRRQSYMSAYYGKNAPQEANEWSGNNLGRFKDPQFDQLYDAARAELDA